MLLIYITDVDTTSDNATFDNADVTTSKLINKKTSLFLMLMHSAAKLSFDADAE